MTLAGARQALRSDATMVLIEAPAGCGKTYQAVEAAVDLADGLPAGQEVLLLAHTNAAVQEFRRRARARRARVRAMTLDAFALELVAPYAASLGLPTPLRMGQGGVPFAVLAPKLGELLDRCPSITSALAGHYPVVILDEHQDARTDQHRIATLLTATGRSRLCIFGDPMQAIYGFAGELLIDWAALAATVDTVEALEVPQRWSTAPRLGEWIMAAREALRSGGVLPLESAPPEVEVHFLADLDDMPNPNSAQVPRPLIRPLQQVMDHVTGSVAVLASHNRHVLGLRRATVRHHPGRRRSGTRVPGVGARRAQSRQPKGTSACGRGAAGRDRDRLRCRHPSKAGSLLAARPDRFASPASASAVPRDAPAAVRAA
jgi:hypothetical protein